MQYNNIYNDPFDVDSPWNRQKKSGAEVDHRGYKYNRMRCLVAKDGRKQRSCVYYIRNQHTRKCLFLMKGSECIVIDT